MTGGHDGCECDVLKYTGDVLPITEELIATNTHFDGVPWCCFERGHVRCINDPCVNPRHRETS